VREGCRLGAEVILHAGAVVGSDGFGYAPGPGGLLKIPQIGRAVLGGQVGVADHLALGYDVKIGAQSGLDRDVPDGSLLIGTPAVEHKRAFRLIALLHRLPELFDRVKRLETGSSPGGGGPGEGERS